MFFKCSTFFLARLVLNYSIRFLKPYKLRNKILKAIHDSKPLTSINNFKDIKDISQTDFFALVMVFIANSKVSGRG